MSYEKRPETGSMTNEAKIIVCKAVFQSKLSFNIFKGLVILHQEVVAGFTSFISSVKRTQ